MNYDEIQKELQKAQEECTRLREENSRLKAMLERFGLKSAAKLEETPTIPTKALTPKKQLPQTVTPAKPQSNNTISDIVSQRIKLFRSLFKSRDDIYAVRWQNRHGRSGYSPACANEWDALLCQKPCSKCSNAIYIPLTDDVIRQHLLGEITVGLYPLLQDETCWFLAVDFDKAGWQEDARSFIKTCKKMAVPAYLERSRSGNGAHVWIFFEEPVTASLARRLGSTILTQTMETHHQIGFESYDRFFPNQDTMPKGGFGNLIALPLQKVPRKQGNAEFLDENMEPYERQWGLLEQVQRISIAQVEGIVNEASLKGQVLGVRLPEMDEEAENDPWTLPPSRKKKAKVLEGPFPESINIVQSNMLFIEKSNISHPLLNRIVRLAAFQNPEFYAAQAMRLSTFDKPRIISCTEEFPKHLALPRGCLNELCDFLNLHKIEVNIQDKRHHGDAIDVQFQGDLSAEQKKIVKKIEPCDQGVLSAPTGFGKTVLAAWMIEHRKTNTLVLLHRTALLEQWREQLALFLGLTVKDIGVIGGGQKKLTGKVDIAMMQSLQRKGEVKDLIADYGQIIVDECHHISAFTFERVMKEAKAKYVLGLTATPIRKDGHHPIIFMQCGPLLERIHPRSAAAKRSFAHQLLIRTTNFSLEATKENPSITEVYSELSDDTRRNNQIVEDIIKAVDEGRQCLVITERIAHLECLAELLRDKVERCIVLHGGLGKKKRMAALETLKQEQDSPICIVATGRYIGEGFDHAPLDTLFLTMPISWRGALQQYIGRLHRNYANKQEVRVYDYVDQNVPMLKRMFNRRYRGYKAFGYNIQQQMLLPETSSD